MKFWHRFGSCYKPIIQKETQRYTLYRTFANLPILWIHRVVVEARPSKSPTLVGIWHIDCDVLRMYSNKRTLSFLVQTGRNVSLLSTHFLASRVRLCLNWSGTPVNLIANLIGRFWSGDPNSLKMLIARDHVPIQIRSERIRKWMFSRRWLSHEVQEATSYKTTIIDFSETLRLCDFKNLRKKGA